MSISVPADARSSVRSAFLDGRLWAQAFWLTFALCCMPSLVYLEMLEQLSVVLVLLALCSAFFFPALRGPSVILLCAFYPRTVEYDPSWSLIISIREPAPNVLIPALISPLDASLVLLALSVLLPAWLHRRQLPGSLGLPAAGLVAVYICSAVLGGGTYGPPYDSEWLAILNLVRVGCAWVVLSDAAARAPVLPAVTFLFCCTAFGISSWSHYWSVGLSGSAVEVWEARGQSFNMSSNSYAACGVMCGLLGLTLWVRGANFWHKLGGAVSTVVSALGVTVAFSRAGILVFVLGVTLFLSIYRRFWLIAWSAVLVVCAVSIFNVPEINGRVALLQSGAGALEDHARSLIYPQTLAMIRDNWLLGVGPYRYFEASLPYLPVGLYKYAGHAHSLPLQVIVDLGVFGALFAGALGIDLWRRLRTTLRGLSAAGGGAEPNVRLGAVWAATAGLLLQMTDSLYLNYRFFIMWLVPIALAASCRDREVGQIR